MVSVRGSMACAHDLHSGTEAQDLSCGNLGPKP